VQRAPKEDRIRRVPYGHEELEFMLQPWFDVDVVESAVAEPLADVPAAVRQALQHPVPSPRRLQRILRTRNAALSEYADDASALARPHGSARAVIAVTDLTRASPDDILVPPLLDELNVGGIPDERITVVVAVGLHRDACGLQLCLREAGGRGVAPGRSEVVGPQKRVLCARVPVPAREQLGVDHLGSGQRLLPGSRRRRR